MPNKCPMEKINNTKSWGVFWLDYSKTDTR